MKQFIQLFIHNCSLKGSYRTRAGKLPWRQASSQNLSTTPKVPQHTCAPPPRCQKPVTHTHPHTLLSPHMASHQAEGAAAS